MGKISVLCVESVAEIRERCGGRACLATGYLNTGQVFKEDRKQVLGYLIKTSTHAATWKWKWEVYMSLQTDKNKHGHADSSNDYAEKVHVGRRLESELTLPFRDADALRFTVIHFHRRRRSDG